MTDEGILAHIDELMRHRVRYIEGGMSPESGFFCKGFVLYVYNDCAGMQVSEDLYAERKNFRVLEPGEMKRFLDLVVLKPNNLTERHVGVMIDHHRFVHCSAIGNGISINSLGASPWCVADAVVGRHVSRDHRAPGAIV